ncbi:MAG: AraC family transcriptional regulator [Dehalococcoidales bacterium]|nr:AraC family transcriptional regulator [Dehalococcoidales bacterium]
MFEWNMSVQKMLDCVEENLTAPLTLEMLAARLNYSPFYCTRQFHKYAGISLRNYIRLRKVASSVIDLRDTGDRIIDIAVKYGFSSQEAFTRSFKKAYGMTPHEYRVMPKPLPLLVKRNAFNPYYLGLMEDRVNEDLSKNITVSVQVVPAHKFIGIRYLGAPGYFEFWHMDEAKYHRDRCDEVDGLLSSIKSFNGIVGAWYTQNGKNGYMYGVEVPPGYSGEIPEGMECISFPESPYAVFHHPPYDFAKQELSVHEALKKIIAGWDPAEHGYAWRDDLPTYQRHNTENWGQAWVKPMKKLK